jgi:hypothetical protein
MFGAFKVDIQTLFDARNQAVELIKHLKSYKVSSKDILARLKLILRFEPDLMQANPAHDDFNSFYMKDSTPEV